MTAGPPEADGMDERSRRWERRFETPMLIAALLVVPALAIENADVGPAWRALAAALNWIVWCAFAVELLVMLAVVPRRGVWLRRHPLELAIVLLTPPFLPEPLQATRVFRLLRLLRLVEAVRLARRLFSPGGLMYVGLLALLTVMLGGLGFAVVEKEQDVGAWDGVWWAVTTVTTVGYGDLAPRTPAGRGIAVVVMLVGIGFVALLTAGAAQRFIRGQDRQAREAAEREDAALRQARRELLERLDGIADRLASVERSIGELRRERASGAAHGDDLAPAPGAPRPRSGA